MERDQFSRIFVSNLIRWVLGNSLDSNLAKTRTVHGELQCWFGLRIRILETNCEPVRWIECNMCYVSVTAVNQ